MAGGPFYRAAGVNPFSSEANSLMFFLSIRERGKRRGAAGHKEGCASPARSSDTYLILGVNRKGGGAGEEKHFQGVHGEAIEGRAALTLLFIIMFYPIICFCIYYQPRRSFNTSFNDTKIISFFINGDPHE